MDINTDGEDNITIGYDHIPWRILQVIVTYLMKPWESVKFYKSKKGTKLETINIMKFMPFHYSIFFLLYKKISDFLIVFLLLMCLSWGLCLILPWGLHLTSFGQDTLRQPLAF